MIPLRDENPRGGTPFFVIGLILLNILVFAHEIKLGRFADTFIQEYAILPVEIAFGVNLPGSMLVPPYLTLVSSMFLHGGFGHIIGNMWFLWIFGDNIELRFGRLRFLVFYLVTGVLAGLTHVFLNPDSTIPTVGASGAISGVLGAYMVLYPRVRVKTLVPIFVFLQIFRVPAILFLGVWFLGQALGIMSGGDGASSVAFGAHVGGFVAGLLFGLFERIRRPEKVLGTFSGRGSL
jgi:membrane associated rhomboid family serine protease